MLCFHSLSTILFIGLLHNVDFLFKVTADKHFASSVDTKGEGAGEMATKKEGRKEKEGGERRREVGERIPCLAGFKILSEALTAGVECDDNIAPRRMQRFP